MQNLLRWSLGCVLVGICSCQVAEGVVQCNFDQDCPSDAGIPYCTEWVNLTDGGTSGTCTGDDEFDGDFLLDGGVVN